MRLLLTSSGLTTSAINNALQDLVGKKPSETKVAFIPTAANPDRGDKAWLIRNFKQLADFGYYTDIIELTATKPSELEVVLEGFDVIYVGGGNTFYLSYWMEKTGLFTLLPKLLESKVYVGVSAGSMVMGKSLILSSQAQNNPQAFEDEDYDELGPKSESSGKAIGLVDFIFRPHLNSRVFSLVRQDLLEEKAKQTNSAVYALDDESALKIIDGKVEVISDSDWVFLPKE